MAQITKKQQQEIEKKVEEKIKKRLFKQLATKADLVSQQYKQHVSTAIITALSLLTALTWKDFIEEGIDNYLLTRLATKSSYGLEFISVVLITAIAVTGIILVSRWSKKEDKKSEDRPKNS